jgi:hypothetical protein
MVQGERDQHSAELAVAVWTPDRYKAIRVLALLIGDSSQHPSDSGCHTPSYQFFMEGKALPSLISWGRESFALHRGRSARSVATGP